MVIQKQIKSKIFCRSDIGRCQENCNHGQTAGKWISALHPKAVCQFLDMMDSIANQMGLQIFITSHSYFVIKKLRLIAMKKEHTVSCISLNKGQEAQVCDLYHEMPDNSIIDTSIQLYEQEIEEVF